MKIKLRVLAFFAIAAMSAIGPAKAAAIYDANEILFSCEKGRIYLVKAISPVSAYGRKSPLISLYRASALRKFSG